MKPNANEAVNLNDAKIKQVDFLDDNDILLGFSNGATVRVGIQALKTFALVHAREIIYPDGTTS